MTLLLGLFIVAIAVYAIVRQVDVRLVMLLAALTLAFLAGTSTVLTLSFTVPRPTSGAIGAAFVEAPMQVLRKFLSTISDEKYVVPICSAMGFAFILRATECDQHLVRFLIRPFRRVRPLLVPATVLIGFLVNIPLVSQTSTAVAVGTVLVPLLRAARIRDLTIASALVLGASIGGELLNAAAPELRSVADSVRKIDADAHAQKCVARVLPLIWPHLAVATAVFCATTWWTDRKWKPAGEEPIAPEALPIDIVKALVPFVPLVVLFVTSPPLSLIQIPKHWLVNVKSEAEVNAFESRLIGASMLIGVAAAALTDRRRVHKTVASFFEGAGYGFTHIIALIVAASCFGEGIKLIGFDKFISRVIGFAPGLLLPLAAVLPLLFGILSGSGMAATQSLYPFFVGPTLSAGADPYHVGAVVSIGAGGGRTASPVAAVTLMASKMTDTNPFAVAGRVAIPIIVALCVTTALAFVLK